LYQFDRFGIGDAFLFEHTSGQYVGCVVWFDRDSALDDGWAVVVYVVGEVDGATGFASARLEDGFVDSVAVHSLSAEVGEECGVDVEDSADVVIGDGEKREVACEADDVGFG